MKVTRYNANARMSQAVVYNGFVFLAGQCAPQNRGKSITEQTKEILANIEKFLAEAGSDKHHMISASVWLSDIKDLAEFNALWDAWVPEGKAPARACVESTLVFPDYNVEVAVIAAVKE